MDERPIYRAPSKASDERRYKSASTDSAALYDERPMLGA